MTESGRVVVAAKLRPPSVPGNAARRDRLHHLLDSVFHFPVTSVTAPAGFGKSWLVASWLREHPGTPQAWVTLDRLDADPVRFWSHVLQATAQSTLPDAGREALRVMDAADAAWPLIVDSLAAGLAARHEHFILVLDESQRLAGDEVLASLTQFLSQLPSNSHVVLVGRHDPSLMLARRRLVNELLEIRTLDMRCTQQESVDVVTTSLGLDLPYEAIDEVRERTMGWITGIRLASSAAARRDDVVAAARELSPVGAVAGAYDALGDYLVEEVLGEMDGELSDFLLDTCVLTELNPPLCDAVSRRRDSAERLDHLARTGMFTSRLEGVNPHYRYDDMFRDALTTLLYRGGPQRPARSHRRAAEWLSHDGQLVDAVEHAVSANDSRLAQRILVEATSPLLAARQIDTLVALFEDVDALGAELAPSTLMSWAGAALYSSRPATDIDRLLERTRRRLASLTPDEEAEAARDLMVSAEPFHESVHEFRVTVDATIAHRQGDLDLALAGPKQLNGRKSETGFVEAAAGEALIAVERYTEGLALTEDWQRYCNVAANDTMGVTNLAHCLSIAALARVGQGHLVEADQLANRAVEALRMRGLTDRPQYAVAALPTGWVAWERGDLAAAGGVGRMVLRPIRQLGEIPAEVSVRMLLARTYWSAGNREAAEVELDKSLAVGGSGPVSRHLAERVALERTRFALLSGDVAGAQLALPDWQVRVSAGAATMREYLLLHRMLLEIDGDAGRLEDLALPPEADVAASHRIEIHKLAALAALARHDETLALDELTAAMAIAAHTGHRQTFLDEQSAFGVLLDNAAARGGLVLRPVGLTAPDTSTQEPVAALVEPLTERELQVLRLLPSHYSYRQIAEHLFVSPNTVKSYVKSVYRKLDAERRSDAVDKARALGLVT